MPFCKILIFTVIVNLKYMSWVGVSYTWAILHGKKSLGHMILKSFRAFVHLDCLFSLLYNASLKPRAIALCITKIKITITQKYRSRSPKWIQSKTDEKVVFSPVSDWNYFGSWLKICWVVIIFLFVMYNTLTLYWYKTSMKTYINNPNVHTHLKIKNHLSKRKGMAAYNVITVKLLIVHSNKW